MKKILLLLVSLLGLVQYVQADSENDRWCMHLSYYDVTEVVSSDQTLYGLYNGNLLSYDVDAQSVRFYDKSNSLSDKGISQLDYSDENHCAVLVYSNNNVDFLYDDGTVVNLPQIKNFTDVEVEVVSLTVNQQWAAIATRNGVIVVNIPDAEIKGYYQLDRVVRRAAVVDKQVYALIGNDLYRGNIMDNLYDFSQWVKASDIPTEDILPYGNGLYQLVSAVPGLDPMLLGAFYLRNPLGKEYNPKTQVTNIWVIHGSKSGDRIRLASPNHVVYLDGNEPEKEQGYVRNVGNFPSFTTTADGSLWMVDEHETLHRYEIDVQNKTLNELESSLGVYGPRRDMFYNIRYAGDRLLVAGGRKDYVSDRNFPPTAMYYEDGVWTALPETGFTLEENGHYRNVMSIAQHPSNASDIYVSCMNGVLHFKDNEFIEQFHHNNSPLRIAEGGDNNPDYLMVDGLSFDVSGNLWMTNYATRDIIHVLKADGTWKSFYDREFTQIITPEKLLLSKDGKIWVTSRRTTSFGASGLYCLDIDGSIDDESDDRSLFRSSAPNQDGTTCSFYQVQALCEDLNGQIWIGCANGVYAVTHPENWFSLDKFRIYQPKVPRNDGTNLADYLLTGINVSAIAVDAGNRKWIGTFGSGIYVVSPDGSEVIEHFSMENCPILSDNIYSMAFHPTSGELMIGTDAGLCSYQSHVSPAVQTMDKNSVKVYPNPVRPEYHGKIVIAGLSDGAEVKIVSAGSQLVARGNAVGGSFEWDGCNMMNGRRVAAGVYYVLAAGVNGGGNVAAKIVVI